MTFNKRGSRLALIGGLLGMAAGLLLGGFRAFGGPPPQRTEEALGNVVFTLILISPYIIALVSARLDANTRGPLLVAASLLSLASMGISLAGVGVVFLPAVVLLIIAAVRSLKEGGWHGHRTFVPAGLAVVATTVIGLSLASLFMHDDPRCWAWVKYNGRTEWNNTPAPEGVSQGTGSQLQVEVGPLPPGATSAGSECTSDIITSSEAYRGLGILAAGAALLTTGWCYGRHSSASSLTPG